MKRNQAIVIGKTESQPAIILRPCFDAAPFTEGVELPRAGPLGKLLEAMHVLPDILMAEYLSSTRLMEVQINGSLVRASDGVGFRAFSVGDAGITQQARLFEPSDLATLVDIAAVWRLASVVVGQKHLADIGDSLAKLEMGVASIAQFQRDEQAVRIESSYEYLRQVEAALMNGEREPAVRLRLEMIEADMDAIQRHLEKLFDSRLNERIKDENFLGYSDIEEGLPRKMNGLASILAEHHAAGFTRAGALQMLGLFSGEAALKLARARAICEAVARHGSMCDAIVPVMAVEAAAWSGKSESFLTNSAEIAMGQTWLHRKLDDLARGALESAGVKLDAPAKINFRGPSGSDTPRLDALKIVAATYAEKVASDARQRLKTLEIVCDAIGEEGTPTTERCLVEWGPAGPVRIIQLAAI